MSTTEETPKKAKAEAKAEEQDVVEEQSLPQRRYITVSVDIETAVEHDDVTDEMVAAAAREQITLPNALWVSTGLGQSSVTVLGATGTGSTDSGDQLSAWEAGYGREASPEEEEAKAK